LQSDKLNNRETSATPLQAIRQQNRHMRNLNLLSLPCQSFLILHQATGTGGGDIVRGFGESLFAACESKKNSL
jgi:hypothetical protein